MIEIAPVQLDLVLNFFTGAESSPNSAVNYDLLTMWCVRAYVPLSSALTPPAATRLLHRRLIPRWIVVPVLDCLSLLLVFRTVWDRPALLFWPSALLADALSQLTCGVFWQAVILEDLVSGRCSSLPAPAVHTGCGSASGILVEHGLPHTVLI